MINIKLISVEITNRSYTSIVPIKRIEGTTSGSGTAYVYTNVLDPLTLNVGYSSSFVIHNDNGVSQYIENGTTKNVGTSQTFYLTNGEDKSLIFSGSNNFSSLTNNSKTLSNFSTSGGVNFGHNLTTKKLKYTLNNAELKTNSISLTNQLLRCYGNFNKTSDTVNSKGIILNTSGHVSSLTNSTAEQYTDPCIDTYNGGNYGLSTTQWNWTIGGT